MQSVKQRAVRSRERKKIEISRAGILRQLVFSVVFVVLRFCGTPGFAGALCFGFFVACVFGRQNVWFAAAEYICSSLFFEPEIIFAAAASAAIVIAAFILMTLSGRPTTKWLLLLVSIVGQAFYLIYGVTEAVVFQRLFNIAAGATFSFVAIFTLRCVLLRGLRYHLNEDEKICLSVFVICAAMGLSAIEPFGFPLLRLAAAFSILAVLFVFGSLPAIFAAVLAGAGSAFGTGALTEIAAFSLWAVAAISFKKLPRFLTALSVPMADFIVRYFFLGTAAQFLDIAAVAVGAVLFACLPKKSVDLWANKMGQSGTNFASRHLINRTKHDLSAKLFDLSEIFFEMRRAFFAMVKGVLPKDKAKIALAKEVSARICTDCQERAKCWRTNIIETEKAFISTVENALDRGKATILDLPECIAQNCKRINGLLSYVNQSVSLYKHQYSVTENADNSRMLIGEQLAGVSAILKNLSEQSQAPARYDTQKERELFEELSYIGILTKEVIVAQDGDNLSVTVVANSMDSLKRGMEEAVSKICARRMALAEKAASADANWMILTFLSPPKFDVSFGFAAVKRTGSAVSGDTHSFLRLSREKFLLALCDGMGSGPQAEKASSTAISLVENFYKAGFDNETILSSVNKLLALGQEEVFTAVDISVVDLKNGLCDFIKIGAPGGYVKSGGEVELVSSGALPLGVLEEMKPHITKKALNRDDLIFMISDGVLDAFGSKEKVAGAISKLSGLNPQEAADQIMAQALNLSSNNAPDDMTIIAARVFET